MTIIGAEVACPGCGCPVFIPAALLTPHSKVRCPSCRKTVKHRVKGRYLSR